MENWKELNETIQRLDNLNVIKYDDIAGPGFGRHNYKIERGDTGETLLEIHFQCGARCEDDSIPGVLDADLLEIVRHRIQCFQKGQFATRENACALTHLEEALMWLNKRKEDRKARGVLGKHEK